jgi:hypothetical protein
VPGWKRREWARDVLAAGDPANRPDAVASPEGDYDA